MDKIPNKKTDGNFANTVLADAVYKPILFSTPMVQAILDGRKTQTRRIIKTDAKQIDWMPIVLNGYGGFCDEHGNPEKPKYKIGEILWVRETFQPIEHPELKYRYRADHLNPKSVVWKPSIFMPKDAVRIFLKVTNVRVERVQDITAMDAYSEGIKMTVSSSDADCYLTAEEAFQLLWESINGKESWKSNPWVWVYDFERIERPLGFC